MRKNLTLSERLIVGADFKPTPPNGRAWVRAQVLGLADTLAGTGVYLKVNTALRACGYGLIEEIHSRGLRVFADLKLFDIPETLATDGALLQEVKPELLTVTCVAAAPAMCGLKQALPDTEVLGVTMLTSQGEDEAKAIYSRKDVVEVVMLLAQLAQDASIDGLISAATEAQMLRDRFGDSFTINTPAIRPLWSVVEGDDQARSRIMTPTKALQAGADRIVVARPIVQAADRYAAAMRTLEEIAEATAA